LKIENFSKEFTPLIDKEIKKIIESRKFPNLYDGMEYAISAGGKRLRPVICLTICKTLGGNIEDALPFVAFIEIIHNFTLVHDDIEDGDELRRGLPSVWKKYGIPHAINIGDGMIFKAYESMLKSSLPPEKVLKLAGMFTDTIMEIIEGQNMELNLREKDFATVDEYEEMAGKKAGVLFGLSLSGGAFIVNASEQTVSDLMEYGKMVGTAFQIRDDILNLTGKQEKYGKEIYGDIREGKRTLVIINCLENCNKLEKGKLLEILKKPREKVNNDDISFVLSLIKKYKSTQFASKYAEELLEESKKYLKNIDDRLRGIIEEFSEFMVKREY
jgi:geranylgeranyl diphosphate synthase type I